MGAYLDKAIMANGALDTLLAIGGQNTLQKWFVAGTGNENVAHSVRHMFFFHAVVRLLGAKEGLDITTVSTRLVMASYALESIYFIDCLRKGRAVFAKIAPTIVLPLIMMYLISNSKTIPRSIKQATPAAIEATKSTPVQKALLFRRRTTNTPGEAVFVCDDQQFLRRKTHAVGETVFVRTVM
jgi:hypothetical protein